MESEEPGPATLPPGCSLHHGRYRIERLTTQRAPLNTYAATALATDTQVTVLELRWAEGTQWADVEAIRERFLDTARRLAGVARPGLPQAIDAFTEARNAYTVWSVAGGEPIGAAVAGRPLSPSDALAHFLRVLVALDGCHSVGCLHLGLNAESVLIDADGEVAFPPPGLAAKPSLSEGPRDPYTAPELTEDSPPTPAADVYSAGALLYLMLTGKAPPASQGDTPGFALEELVERQSGLDPRLAEACLSALDSDPRRRPSVRDLAELTASLQAARRPLHGRNDGRRSWRQLLTSSLIERIGAEPQPVASALGWQVDRLRWAEQRTRCMDAGERERIEGELLDLLEPVALSHPTASAATEWGCMAALVAVFIWFAAVVITLGSVTAISLVVGSVIAIAVLVGAVEGLAWWHRLKVRWAARTIASRYPDSTARDDAIAVLYGLREHSLAASETLDALEGMEGR